ncbi:MAG TPA: hypothetical protein VIK80_01450 [Flavihumibacter sp.]
MKPLIVLALVFVIALVVIRLLRKQWDFRVPALIAMSAMLLFTAMGHFMFTAGMTMMLPDFVPFKKEMVYLTGLIEIAAAIGLLVPRFRVLTGWLLILFFVLLLPANIHAAIRHVDYQNATFEGDGPVYLWFRVPLQILFIAWVYFAAIKSPFRKIA